MPTIGLTARPTGLSADGGTELWIGNSQRQEADRLAHPGDPARILVKSLGIWVRGYTGQGSINVTLALWKWGTSPAEGNGLQAQTLPASVSEGAYNTGNTDRLLNIVRPLVTPYEWADTDGDVLVGFHRDGNAHQLGYSTPGTHYHRASTSSSVGTMNDRTGDTGVIHAYIADYDPIGSAWIRRGAAWIRAAEVQVRRGAAWADSDAVQVRRTGGWTDAD